MAIALPHVCDRSVHQRKCEVNAIWINEDIAQKFRMAHLLPSAQKVPTVNPEEFLKETNQNIISIIFFLQSLFSIFFFFFLLNFPVFTFIAQVYHRILSIEDKRVIWVPCYILFGERLLQTISTARTTTHYTLE